MVFTNPRTGLGPHPSDSGSSSGGGWTSGGRQDCGPEAWMRVVRDLSHRSGLGHLQYAATSGTVTSVLGVPLCAQQQNTVYSRNVKCGSRTLCHRPRHQRQLAHLPATSRTSATSSTTNLRFREHRDSIQPQRLVQYITDIDNNKVTNSHLYRQYISTQPQQQARPQQTVEAHRSEIPLRSGHPSYRPCEHPESDIAQQPG